MKEIIKCNNITKKIGVNKILNSISITVYEGDIYGFLGPNGAGKSTTIKTILGLIEPDIGEVYIDNISVKRDRRKAMLSVGAMVEAPSFYTYLSGYKNLLVYGSLYNISKDRILEVLKMVGLEKDMNKKVGKYSMGMKQRLAIARAFLNNPKVVILDEPTNGLDPQGVVEVRNLIRDLKDKRGVTFVLCSHILGEVQELCNRLSIVDDGSVVVEGEASKLLGSSGNVLIINTDDRDKVYALLEKFPEVKNVEKTPKGLRAKCTKDIYMKVNKMLINSELNFSEIKREEVSLEKFFLSKIKEDKKNA